MMSLRGSQKCAHIVHTMESPAKYGQTEISHEYRAISILTRDKNIGYCKKNINLKSSSTNR